MKRLLSMRDKVDLYFRHRRRLNYTKCGVESGLLKFAAYVDQTGYKGPLTISLACKWAAASKEGGRKAWARRLTYLHGFAKYYKAIDPKTEIPPFNIFGFIYRRPKPYIYSKKEIADLLEITKVLTPTNGLKPTTYKYLLGLLASTGLRISEAIKLNRQEVNLNEGILTICETKHHKSRYVPLHKTTKMALKTYSAIRDKKIPAPLSTKFFITDRGRSLLLGKTEKEFRQLRTELGLKNSPRLYDFRHTFACQRLLEWYKEGKNINRMMIYLSTYLGHVHVTDTYWYLTATPELMSMVSKKFEHYSKYGSGD